MFKVISEKLQGILERFLYKNNRNYNFYKFSYKFDLILVLSFHRNHKQQGKFQQAGDLVTRNISAFVYSESRSTSNVY